MVSSHFTTLNMQYMFPYNGNMIFSCGWRHNDDDDDSDICGPIIKRQNDDDTGRLYGILYGILYYSCKH